MEILVVIAIAVLFYLLYTNRNTTISMPSKIVIPLSRSALRKTFPTESKGESRCRRVLEELFKKSFPRTRPDFLKNAVTGKNLEIDCYNAEMKLGIEYSGRQHYKFTPSFHKDQQTFLNQRYRDEMKKSMLEKQGITLVEVPYSVPLEDIEDYLKIKLKERGFL